MQVQYLSRGAGRRRGSCGAPVSAQAGFERLHSRAIQAVVVIVSHVAQVEVSVPAA